MRSLALVSLAAACAARPAPAPSAPTPAECTALCDAARLDPADWCAPMPEATLGPAIIEGRVIDEAGAPAAALQAILYGIADERQQVAATDADGRFRFEVTSDAYALSITPPQSNELLYFQDCLVPTLDTPLVVEARLGPPAECSWHDRAALPLRMGHSTIFGRVLTEGDLTPVPDALVVVSTACSRRTVRTGRDGSWVVDRVYGQFELLILYRRYVGGSTTQVLSGSPGVRCEFEHPFHSAECPDRSYDLLIPSAAVDTQDLLFAQATACGCAGSMTALPPRLGRIPPP